MHGGGLGSSLSLKELLLVVMPANPRTDCHIYLFLQSTLVRTFQTVESSISISGLSACQSYWVEVTAIDSNCNIQLSSSPELIGLHQLVTFEFVILTEDSASCRAWIADNTARKLSDVRNIITSELQDCGISASCAANDQYSCEGNPEIITYE